MSEAKGSEIKGLIHNRFEDGVVVTSLDQVINWAARTASGS